MAGGSSKAIENIRPGDIVKSYNPVTGKIENKRVLQTFENETSELVTVSTTDGQKVTSTPGHKFFANNEWVSAVDLKAGDILVTVNGEKVIVEKIQHELLESPVKVYNINVDYNNNYYVSECINSSVDEFVLVHNVCQKHHVITKKMKDAMVDAKYLKNIDRNKSSILPALTEEAHKGYQEWHREYDRLMVDWIQNHKNATITKFQKVLQEFYDRPDIQERFGKVVIKLIVKSA